MAMLAAAAPAYAQAGQTVKPGESACQAPSGQTDKAACPDTTQEPTDSGTTGVSNAPPTTEAGGPAIVVTGTRIGRTTFNSPDSITVVTRDRSTQAGFNSTAGVLQSVAITGGTAQVNDTYGGLVTDGGAGANTLSLRGLGATRSLVLLNGRRVSPAGSQGAVGSVDLNVLPNAIVDRMEVLNSGASSIYGSDAIAGVVNVITRNKINGLTLEGSSQFPEIGAGGSRRIAAVGGTSGSNWSVQGSVEWYKRDLLRLGDVPSLRCGQELYADGSDFIDPATGESKCFPIDEGGVSVNLIATGTFNGQSVVLAPGINPAYNGTCNRFRPNPLVTTGLLPGFECAGGGSISLNIRDTSTSGTLNQSVVSGAEVLTGYLSGNLDTSVLGNATIYTEVLASRRKSRNTNELQLNIDYPINSPLIPANLVGHPVNSGLGLRVFASRGAQEFRQQVDFVKASIGMRGDLPFKDWAYDLYHSRAWSDAEYHIPAVLLDRLAQSSNVVSNGSGGFNCVDPTGGCVAQPVFTPGLASGSFNGTAWYDYVTEDVVGTTKFREQLYVADINGSLFPIWGGDVKAALGIEYRKNAINDQPSPDAVALNLQNYAGGGPTVGSDSVYELYGEVQAPLLKDVPFAKLLSLEASYRYTHYKSYGGDTTYKIGALWRPSSFLSFRGSYGTSYRAPALFEQYIGGSEGFQPGQNDPCDQLQSVTNFVVLQQCQADGLPANFVQNGGIKVITVGGAESGLKAETSKNLTYGVVLQHNFGDAIGAFSFAADYFRTEVNNGVSQLSYTNILDECYENPQRLTCYLIERGPYTGPGTGSLSVTSGYVNIATSLAKGIDFVANYTRRLGPGTLSLDGQAVRMLDRYDQTLPSDTIVQSVGLTANPKWAGTFDARYKVNNLSFLYGFDYIHGTDDAQYLEQFGYTPEFYNFKVDDYMISRASVRFENRRYQFTLGVRNLFDKQPPKITTTNPLVNTQSNVPIQGGYDFLGRTFFMNARVNF
ncbi:TonB-dependent receptor [Sphingomonas sinipercae]|uniref:TonB-dependent receptor n=2 Tax=Sphingomonas sinipercae TaxID=2714944 RepID=A0A6G7ZNR3_9SPHN|nr:TonB-dependent receptor [Sphingomonas sinipercae]